MSRRDVSILGGGAAAVIVAAAFILTAVLGPAGASPTVAVEPGATGSAAPSTSTSTGPVSGSSGPSTDTAGRRCPGAPDPTKDFRLVIPKLAIDAHAEPLGVDALGNLGTPAGKFCNVGWYARGPAPGAPGDSVMDGHLDWNGSPAVFWKLGTLKQGDEIVVKRDGAVLHFRVETSLSVPYNSQPADLYNTSGKPRLSLITCAGNYDPKRSTYLQRLIVNASYVNRSA